eukprot:TRINITY_DN2340_c0_g1_i1.p4 TRINITY_DN2340_c0_g1~~TRINITY_DN2340_c0_g1_i1.p4  ORF type:complete len:136 (+),score=13.66 TRINITY_DN2340_c0_g1_i1:857-1264(+)
MLTRLLTGIPKVWLLEGLVMWLTQPDVVRLLQRIAALSAPGDWLLLHTLPPDYAINSQDAAVPAFRSALSHPAELLVATGFSNNVECTTYADILEDWMAIRPDLSLAADGSSLFYTARRDLSMAASSELDTPIKQ